MLHDVLVVVVGTMAQQTQRHVPVAMTVVIPLLNQVQEWAKELLADHKPLVQLSLHAR
jgi:hypothetical protein